MTNKSECYCCGADAIDLITVRWFGGLMTVYLCPSCVGAEYAWTQDGYWALKCPTHGTQNVKAMVAYWNAIDLFNEKWCTRKRGTKIKYGVDWQFELEKLREEWRAQEGQITMKF